MVRRLLGVVLSLMVLGAAAPAFADGEPFCDVCKICDRKVLISLDDNGFTGTVVGASLLECIGTGCSSWNVDSLLTDKPLYQGQWQSFLLPYMPGVLYVKVKLSYCSTPGCSLPQTVVRTLQNCDY